MDLFFGRTIALAGDFYTTYNENMTPISRAMRTSLSSEPYNVFKINPQEISGQRDRFTSALMSLTEDMDGYLKPLVELFDKEEHGVEEAQQEGSKRAARRMLLKLIISRVTAFLTIWLLDERHPSSFLSIPALPSMRRLHGKYGHLSSNTSSIGISDIHHDQASSPLLSIPSHPATKYSQASFFGILCFMILTSRL